MKKSITFLHPHCMLAGGATTVLLEVTKRLAEDGWQVTVVSVQSNPDIVREAKQAGVTFNDVGGPLSSSIWFWVLYPLMYWRVHKAAKQINSPVVVSEPFPANWWGWFYKKIYPDIQLVYVCHEPTAFIFEKAWINSIKPAYMRWGLKIGNPILRLIEYKLMPTTDIVVVNSNYSKQTVIKTFPKLALEKIKMVYCGIDHTVFNVNTVIDRKRQILVVGTLTQFKRVDQIIKAFAILKKNKRFNDVELVIKGKGVEKSFLLALINDLKLTESVQILDAFYSTDQLADLLRSSYIFVHAAHNEPFGLSPIEALACGTPAIVTGTGGTGETVINGKSGLYFNYESEEDLVQKFEQLLVDERLWHTLSAGAVEQAQKFDWIKTHEDFSNILKEAYANLRLDLPINKLN